MLSCTRASSSPAGTSAAPSYCTHLSSCFPLRYGPAAPNTTATRASLFTFTNFLELSSVSNTNSSLSLTATPTTAASGAPSAETVATVASGFARINSTISFASVTRLLAFQRNTRLDGIKIMIPTLVLILTLDRRSSRRKLSAILLRSQRTRLQSRHRIFPHQRLPARARGKQQPPTRPQYIRDSCDQAPLLFGRKQENKSPRQNRIEYSVKKSRLLNRLASHPRVWQIPPERLHKSRRRIHSEHVQPFTNQNLSNRQ